MVLSFHNYVDDVQEQEVMATIKVFIIRYA